jgi:hypothetical protein
MEHRATARLSSAGNAGGVDEDIKPAPSLHNAINTLDGLLLVGDVQFDHARLPTSSLDSGCHPRQSRRMQIAQRHTCTLAAQTQRGGTPNA